MALTSAPLSGVDDAASSSDDLRQRWTVLVAATVFAWVVLPRTIQTVVAPKFRSGVGEAGPPSSALALAADQLLALATIAVCVVAVLRCGRAKQSLSLAALLVMLLPWLYLVTRDAFLSASPVLATVLYPVVVTTVWVLKPRPTIFATLGYLAGSAVVICLLLAAVLPEKGLFRTATGTLVTEDKELVPWGILIGFLTHGNNLGQLLALSVPLVCAIPRGTHRYLLLALTLAALVWTASRSSFLAVGVLAVAALVLAAVPRVHRGAVVGPALVSALALVCVPPLVTDDPGAFTNRGLIWMQSLQWWGQAEWWGLGSDWYAQVGGTSGRISATVAHGHNQLVQLLVTGGLVLVGLVLAQLVFVAVRAGRLARRGNLTAACYLMVLAGTCVLEKSLVLVDNIGVFPVVVLPLAVIAFCADPETADRGDEAAVGDRRSPS